MLAGYHQKKKNKEKRQSLKKRLLKGIKIFLKRKTKSINMLVSNIKIFPKKKTT